MNLLLQRNVRTEKSTVGQLLVDGRFECHTLEDVDRYLELGGEKIKGETAIPAGLYRVTITHSNRFKTPLPLIHDVDGFTGIRIHPGNSDEDTEGCILVGVYTEGVDDWVSYSRSTFAKLFNKIQDALDDGNVVHLEVI